MRNFSTAKSYWKVPNVLLTDGKRRSPQQLYFTNYSESYLKSFVHLMVDYSMFIHVFFIPPQVFNFNFWAFLSNSWQYFEQFKYLWNHDYYCYYYRALRLIRWVNFQLFPLTIKLTVSYFKSLKSRYYKWITVQVP